MRAGFQHSLVIATHGAVSEASSEVKERVMEEMVGKVSNADVLSPSNISPVVDAVHGNTDGDAAIVKGNTTDGDAANIKGNTTDGDAVDVKGKGDGGGLAKAASGVRGDTYSYAYAQVKPHAQSVAEIWSHFVPSTKHGQIVETSPDVFDALPEFFSSRFK
jgi:hypothetical protein